jgi:hypothetical protein
MPEALRTWTVLVCAALVACGPRPETRHPKSDTPADTSEDDAADETEDVSDSKPSEDSKSSEDSKPKTEAKSASSGLAAICDKVNRRAGQKCKKKIAGLYQSSCNHYLKEPGQCEEEIRLVMECQYKAADEAFCAHEADPKCHEANQKLKVCKRGTAPAEQETAEDTTIPSGWEKVRDPQLGFSVALPPGATLDEKSKRRTWQVEENGISYFVAELEPPSGKLSNPVYVRMVVAYVGNRCQQRLKLHGELETKGTTVVQYHSACPDGSEWHGMLHFWGGKVVSTGYHAPAGATGVSEPYFYSFQIGK